MMEDRLTQNARYTLVNLLAQRTGQTLAESRLWRIDTALKPLMLHYNIGSLVELVRRLEGTPGELLASEVTDALLNNESFFFRDHLMFDHLNMKLLDDLRVKNAARKSLSIWMAGCSTGQEAYSLAMLFADDPLRWQGWRVRLVATDVSVGAINRAAQGRYSQFEIQRGLPIGKMIKWFEQEGEVWRVRPELRTRVEFQRQNLLEQTPGGAPFDLILCRNVLLYFSLAIRTKVFSRLKSAISPDGYLMLGAGETVIGQTEDFRSSVDHRGFYAPVPAEPMWQQLSA